MKTAFVGVTLIAVIMLTDGCSKTAPPLGANKGVKPSVIIVKPLEHPSLEQCINGFKQGLSDSGFDSEKIDIELLNANGNFANVAGLVKAAVAKNPNVIFTVTTQAASDAIKITDGKVPLVYSAVTDPVQAGIVSAWERSSTWATGVSDRYPVEEQVAVFTSLKPNAKTFALLYNPAEQNSQILVEETYKAILAGGLTPKKYAVNKADDISATLKAALAENDCAIVTGDNLLTENLHTVIKICIAARKPLFVGDPDSVRKGAVATVGPSYFEIGRLAGQKAAEIIKGKSPGSIPSERPRSFDYIINMEAAAAMNVEVPPTFWRKMTVWESRAAAAK